MTDGRISGDGPPWNPPAEMPKPISCVRSDGVPGPYAWAATVVHAG